MTIDLFQLTINAQKVVKNLKFGGIGNGVNFLLFDLKII
jgi:hypothetical protein